MIKRLSFLLIAVFVVHFGFAQVTANFSANQTAGCPNPFLLSLSSTSSAPGPIDSYSWQLSGPAGFTPQTSVTSQLSTTLTIPGFYTVSLTVCSGGVCDTELQTDFIEVYNLPSIAMTISPLNGCPSTPVCFDGTFTPGCGTISSSVIDVRDGTVYSNVEDVCHTYNSLGASYSNFTVSVTNSCGCIATETFVDVVTVSQGPTASFNSSNPVSCNAPLNVSFNSTSSDVEPGSVYTWNIPPIVNGVSGPNISQSFPAGTYDVELIVTNPNGCQDTIFQPAYVVIGSPQTDFSSNLTDVCPGEAVNFMDMSPGNPVSWSWTFEGHGSSSQQNPTIVFNNPGTWDVTLIAQFPGGCLDTFTIPDLINVTNPPVNGFTVSDSGSCILPFTTTFTSTALNADSVYWSFPGGTPASFSGFGPVDVTYDTYGTYAITMSSYIAGGTCSTTTNFPGVISLAPLSATVSADFDNSCIPVVATYDFGLSGGEIAASQNWLLPGSDIGSSSSANPVAIYTTQGCYDLSLEVISLSGCTATVNETNFLCAGVPPTGGINLTPSSICYEQGDVFFNYTGSGADTILWDFGDSSPPVFADESAVVSHLYIDDIGTYTVTMVPLNNGCPGDTVVYQDSVEILGPIAQFDANFAGCVDWNVFNFTDQAESADSVFYEFGDPTTSLDTSSNPNATWIYPAIDSISTYTVTQFAYNFTTGCVHEASNTIKVFPPNANFTISDSAGCAPLSVTLRNTSLQVGSGSNTKWNLDSTFVFAGPGNGSIWLAGPVATVTYSQPGIYTVILRNRDNRGCFDTLTVPNLITVSEPLAGFVQDSAQTCAPRTVIFSDTSIGIYSPIVDWSWDFGVPGINTDTSSLQNPSFTFNSTGTYNVKLTVTDSLGCTNAITNAVNVLGPTASFTLSNTFICSNQSINVTDVSTGSNLSYAWSFPGGIPDTSTASNPPIITYPLEGFQDILLQVTDDQGCTDDTLVTISVFDVVAQANANIDTVGCFSTGTAISFNNTSFNNVDVSSAVWDLGNGTISTLLNPSAIYNVAGTYIVSMSISSNTGCSDTTVVDTIFVGGPYANGRIIDRDTSCLCETIDFEITTFNTLNPSFIAGDGGIITYVPNGILGDTIIDTISYQYCQSGVYVPEIFVDDGTCSGIVQLTDTIRIDSLITNFTINPFNLCDSGTVCFTDSSYNLNLGSLGLVEYDWDFGDGSTDTVASPCHFYGSSGVYDVQLIVMSNYNCRDTITQQVFIPASPVLSISNDTSLCSGDSAQLSVSGGFTYTWFPNYNITDINAANPVVFPTLDTAYVVDALSAEGCLTRDTVFIDVNDISASFSTPPICSNESVAFTDLSTSDGVITDWLWTFGEPISGPLDTSVLQNPFHDYLSAGSYDVSLIILDDNTCASDTTISVLVQEAPIASFTTDPVCLGQATVFNSNASTSGTGNIVAYQWDFGVSGLVSDTSNQANPSYTYLNPGIYTVCLTIVTDQNCPGNSDDTCFVVQVYDLPTAEFTVDSACVGNVNSFLDLSQAGADANIETFQWDFGQNPVDTLLTAPGSTQFLYDTAGQYLVNLVVVDSNRCEDSFTQTAYVFANPVSDFSFTTTCQNEDNDFVSLPTSGNNSNLSYYWDFDEGLGFQLGDSVETYSFVQTGVHAISHVIVDAFGCSDTLTQTVNVLDAPIAIITGDNTVCRGTSTQLTAASSSISAVPAIYDWSITSSQTSTITYNPNADTRVFLTLTDALGCSDTTSIFIEVLENPEADFDWTDACEDIQFTFNSLAQAGDGLITNYTWNITSPITGTSSYNSINVNYTSPTLDTLLVTLIVDDANGCIDSLRQTVVVDQAVELTALTPDYILCPGDSLLINLADTTQFIANGVGSTIWTPTVGVVSIDGDSIILSPDNSITYTVTALSTLNQCPPDVGNIINVELATDPLITVEATPNPLLVGAVSSIEVGVVPFNVSTDSLVWDNSSATLNRDFGFLVEASPTQDLTYPFQLIYYYDGIRCVEDTSITISVITSCDGNLIYVPNIFTPNDDGRNDEFGMTGYGIDVISYLRIFDRWGQLMFQANDIEMLNGRMPAGTGWLGSNQNGKSCNSGVYVYAYELICANGDVIKGSGNVTLIK